MIPIFSRSWLMKTTAVRDRLIAPASLRSAWLMSRACSPGSESPISPSISALGTSAATESTTTTSTAPERTRISQISSPCSPVSGWDTSKLSTSTPSFFAYSTSSACLRSSVSLGGSALAAIMGVLDMGPGPPGLRPEYIPKLRLAPSRAKCVRQMLQLAVRQRDTIEAIDVRRPAVAIHPDPRRLHELAPLGAGDRLERAPERVPASRLHLNEGDEASLPHDQVDFGVAHTKPVRHDVPPAGEKVLDRLLLARKPALVPLVGPLRRVAAQAGPHAGKLTAWPANSRTQFLPTVPFSR